MTDDEIKSLLKQCEARSDIKERAWIALGQYQSQCWGIVGEKSIVIAKRKKLDAARDKLGEQLLELLTEPNLEALDGPFAPTPLEPPAPAEGEQP